jgi:hypothetical protein
LEIGDIVDVLEDLGDRPIMSMTVSDIKALFAKLQRAKR